MQSENISPLELLKEELEADEIKNCHSKYRKAKLIESTFAISRAYSSPTQLPDLINTEEDEVLFAIAEELGKVWEFFEKDCVALLSHLEALASVDETVVREQACKSLIAISKHLADNVIQDVYAPLIVKLGSGEKFTSRVSACFLFHSAYPRAGTMKEKLRRKFVELCHEDTPMVRRAGASKLGELSSKMEKQHLIAEIIPVFRQLANDEQDAIRVLCIESLVPMASYLSKEENQVHTLGTLLAAAEDKSWKVRLSIAKNFAQLAEAFGKEITDGSLVQVFKVFLTDIESEVRNAAISSLKECLKNISTEKLCSLILPTLQNLHSDSSPAFRAGVAEVLCKMAPLISKDVTKQKVLPLLNELIKDENSDVRLSVTNSLNEVSIVLGPEILTNALITTLTNMTKDAQWRVREAVIILLAQMGKLFGKDIFLKNIEPLFMSYLTDTVSSVREKGIENLKILAGEFKNEWIGGNLLPKLNECFSKEKQGYLYRIACLYSVLSLVQFLNKDEVSEYVVPMLVRGCKDPVPNVRFCAVKIIHKVQSKTDAGVFNSQLRPLLGDLLNDTDRDVQYFSRIALDTKW